jgi:hypothetical protein
MPVGTYIGGYMCIHVVLTSFLSWSSSIPSPNIRGGEEVRHRLAASRDRQEVPDHEPALLSPTTGPHIAQQVFAHTNPIPTQRSLRKRES